MSEIPTRVVFAADAVLQVIDGDALILKLQDEAVFSLNESGARIAELIVAGQTLEQIVTTLAGEYGRTPESISADVRDLVHVLLSRGLLVAGDEG